MFGVRQLDTGTPLLSDDYCWLLGTRNGTVRAVEPGVPG